MSRKKYDDDGRQIADMSGVDVSMFGFATTRRSREKNKTKEERDKEEKIQKEVLTLTKKETWSMMFRAMWTSLLIGLVFVVLAAIFVLFAVYVWFR